MKVREIVSIILRKIGLLGLVRWCKRFIVGALKDIVWFAKGGQRKNTTTQIPIPPPSLCFAVSANYDVDYFLRTGAQGADSIERILARNDQPIDSFNSILDFGCGCGRVIRHWKHQGKSSFTGTDINSSLIRWSNQNLKFGKFFPHTLTSKLPFEEGKFDLIYAISVFTHLSEELQKHWITELKRVLQPGGLLLITVKGSNWKIELDDTQREQFDSGRMIVLEPETSGSNYCGTYHPEEYVRNVLASGLSVIEYEPCGSQDTRQDFYLFSK